MIYTIVRNDLALTVASELSHWLSFLDLRMEWRYSVDSLRQKK